MSDILQSTLSTSERSVLTEFVRRLRKRYGDRITKLAVFGSRARGDVHEDSDIDVLVVLDGAVNWRDRHAIMELACDVALEATDYAELNPRTLSRDQYETLLRQEWRFALDCEREGIRL